MHFGRERGRALVNSRIISACVVFIFASLPLLESVCQVTCGSGAAAADARSTAERSDCTYGHESDESPAREHECSHGSAKLVSTPPATGSAALCDVSSPSVAPSRVVPTPGLPTGIHPALSRGLAGIRSGPRLVPLRI
jgi:hypothetical protein